MSLPAAQAPNLPKVLALGSRGPGLVADQSQSSIVLVTRVFSPLGSTVVVCSPASTTTPKVDRVEVAAEGGTLLALGLFGDTAAGVFDGGEGGDSTGDVVGERCSVDSGDHGWIGGQIDGLGSWWGCWNCRNGKSQREDDGGRRDLHSSSPHAEPQVEAEVFVSP
ncbi:hypothetical protein BJ508DRAFT_348678 [Ascobolus immersus RN42]|uniref:Uncharacterized protein n=1 Tax=Ascobolus immersus RN42 TaxID=1160509 RepID=A0A3N4IJB8_ASCIM|nr:hypothetical protein BJ508DRAFT_348678 [Ascobolus immersus RN42]